MRYFDSSRIDSSEKSREYIRTRYRELVKQYHPDRKQGNEAIMAQINLEYQIAQQGLDIARIVADKQLQKPVFHFLVLVGAYSMLTFCVGQPTTPPKVIFLLQELVKRQRAKISPNNSTKNPSSYAYASHHDPA